MANARAAKITTSYETSTSDYKLRSAPTFGTRERFSAGIKGMYVGDVTEKQA